MHAFFRQMGTKVAKEWRIKGCLGKIGTILPESLYHALLNAKAAFSLQKYLQEE
jgi:hypothetical protein